MTKETKRLLPKVTSSPQSLKLTPYAWAKLLLLRDLGETEVGGFGISSADDLLLVENICLVKQRCTPVTVKFDDASVADYFDRCVDDELPPERFARIWVHTHPGYSAFPSSTDEETFARCFGNSDWSVMFIVAAGGQTYARLHFRPGPGGDVEIPVEIDFTQPFAASEQGAWEEEYLVNVEEDRDSFGAPAKPEPDRLHHDLVQEFLGPFGPALFPDELGYYDPFLEDLNELDRPVSAAGRPGAAGSP